MSDLSLAEMEGFFLTLSDGTRLRLLALMARGEVSVGYLSEKLQTSQPKISRHLAYLRSVGLVETRREGKWIYYRIARSTSPFAARSLDAALDWVAGLSGEMAPQSSATFVQAVDEPQGMRRSGQDPEKTGPYSNELEIYLL